MRVAWLSLCALALVTQPALGWLRYYAPDDEVISRSDAIVIGHVEGPIAPVATPAEKGMQVMFPNGFPNGQHRTTLVVTQVLAGKMPLGPTPLIIHYGLAPVVLESNKPPSKMIGMMQPAVTEKTDPNAPAGIYDSASTMIGGPPSGDLRKDQVWFLRWKERSIGPVAEDTTAPGIWSPDDVQSLDRKAYILAVMSGDPEALTPYGSGDSWSARQARVCQDRLRVKRIDKITDAELKADALVAYLSTEPPYSSAGQLVMAKLTALGPLGLKKLVPVFQDADHDYDRRAILTAWTRGHYQPAAQVIANWLRTEGAWWARQTPQDMLWSFQVGQKGGPEYNDPRAASNRNVYCAVEALWGFGGADARAVIEQTRAQWNALGVRPAPGNDIVSMCDQALSQLR